MAIYIPALGFETLSMMKKYPEYNIFGDTGVYKYGIFLVSAYYAMGAKKNKEITDIRDDVLLW